MFSKLICEETHNHQQPLMSSHLSQRAEKTRSEQPFIPPFSLRLTHLFLSHSSHFTSLKFFPTSPAIPTSVSVHVSPSPTMSPSLSLFSPSPSPSAPTPPKGHRWLNPWLSWRQRMIHNSSAPNDKSSRHWAEKRHIDFSMINKWKIIVFH